MNRIQRSQLSFILRTAILAFLPLFVVWGAFVAFDPVHVFRTVSPEEKYPYFANKGIVSTLSFNKYNPESQFDAIVFGSSLNICVPLDEWCSYLPDSVTPFHFDSSAMTSIQMADFMQYIVDRTELRHALIITMPYLLSYDLDSQQNITYFTPPQIAGCIYNYIEDYLNLWREWIKPSTLLTTSALSVLNPNAGDNILSNTFTGDSYFNFVIHYLSVRQYDATTGNQNITLQRPEQCGDLKLPRISLADSLQQRPPFNVNFRLNDEQEAALRRLARMLDEVGTDYKLVVISCGQPLENNQLLADSDSVLLREIFGERFISAQWPTLEWLNNPDAMYDHIHFTTSECRRLLRYVYNDSVRNSHPGRL